MDRGRRGVSMSKVDVKARRDREEGGREGGRGGKHVP